MARTAASEKRRQENGAGPALKAVKAVSRDSCFVSRDPKTLAGGTAVASRSHASGRLGVLTGEKVVNRKKAVIRDSCLVFRENPWRGPGSLPKEMSDGL